MAMQVSFNLSAQHFPVGVHGTRHTFRAFIQAVEAGFKGLISVHCAEHVDQAHLTGWSGKQEAAAWSSDGLDEVLLVQFLKDLCDKGVGYLLGTADFVGAADLVCLGQMCKCPNRVLAFL